MFWRSCGIATINLICIALPYNIIGCGPYLNPFDNYISFVANDLTKTNSLKPFYYVRQAELYDPFADPPRKDNACADWVQYGQKTFSIEDAQQIIYEADTADLAILCRSLEHNNRPGLRHQPMLDRLIRTRDTAALRYILFAKRTEPLRQLEYTSWTDDPSATKKTQDSTQCSRLVDEALTKSRHTRNPFIRARYAYLATSLAFYSHRYSDCIDIFKTDIHPTTAGGLYPEALSFQAGAAYHSNRKSLAAYSYSRAFALTGPNISDYRGFTWSIDRQNRNTSLTKALALCKNSRERADMLALSSLGSTLPEERSLREVYRVNPASSILEVLTIREVQKIEQNFFSKQIKKQPGGLTMYEEYDFYDDYKPSPKPWQIETRSLSAWFDSIAADPRIPHPGLYKTMAAYLFYIRHDYPKATQLLDDAATMPASPRLRGQQQVTRLLVTINTTNDLDQTRENYLLPAIRSIEKWATQDKDTTRSDLDYERQKPWQRIYRNLLAEIIARRYYKQGDSTREILSIGAAETVARAKDDGYPTAYTLNHIQQYFSAKDCQSLLNKIHAAKTTPWEKYLIRHFPVSDYQLKQKLTTALIREHRWLEAFRWLNQLSPADDRRLHRNPFTEAPNDQIDITLPGDKINYHISQFIKTMGALTGKEQTHRATPEELYQLAIGYYNMSRYGRAQELVDYDGATGNWNELPTGNTNFEKEYYGCYKAEEYALKAQAASKDNEFKARCQFFAAKCAEKRIRIGIAYRNIDQNQWRHASKLYDDRVRNNKHFPLLVSKYANTRFYLEAYNTCSYLEDFVKRSH